MGEGELRFSSRASGGDAEKPLVWCEQCGFQWFGPTAAHGLSVLGSCSRCGGVLGFQVEDPAEAEANAPDAHHQELQPWQVLGAPTSWAGH